MHKTVLALAVLCALALAAPSFGKRTAPTPPGFRAATADAVIIGKVTEVADKAEKADAFKGDTREMKIATVKVESALLGKPGTSVKVGFMIATQAAADRAFVPPSLTKGQEAILFLTKHPTKKDVYYFAGMDDVIDKAGNTTFKTDVEEIKKSAKVFASPLTALKSKDASERLTAAALLVSRYKNATTGTEKTENVPAAESKLILTILADADWTAPGRGGNYLTNPQNLFFNLGATAKDGWEQPKDFAQINALAKKWCKDNAGKFKMTRIVREKLSTQVSEEPE